MHCLALKFVIYTVSCYNAPLVIIYHIAVNSSKNNIFLSSIFSSNGLTTDADRKYTIHIIIGDYVNCKLS